MPTFRRAMPHPSSGWRDGIPTFLMTMLHPPSEWCGRINVFRKTMLYPSSGWCGRIPMFRRNMLHPFQGDVVGYQRFVGPYCVCLQGGVAGYQLSGSRTASIFRVMWQGTDVSEGHAASFLTTWCQNPEDDNLGHHCYGNLRSQLTPFLWARSFDHTFM